MAAGFCLLKNMEEEKQLFKDRSGDREYYTVTPNIIINGYSAVESGVYAYIKKRAGEDGQFFETAFNTARALKISKPTYLRIRNVLEKDNRIKFVGWRRGKTHPVKIYEVVDIWPENIKHYEERKVKNTTTSSKEGSKIEPLERSKIDTQKKNPIEEEPIKNMSDKPTFPPKEEIEKLLTDKRRHIQIIGLWIQEMNLKPENQEQIQSIIHRNSRPASLLKGYKNEDIQETIKILKRTEYLQGHFGIETISKYIDGIVANRKKQGPKILKWEEVRYPNGQIKMKPIYK